MFSTCNVKIKNRDEDLTINVVKELFGGEVVDVDIFPSSANNGEFNVLVHYGKGIEYFDGLEIDKAIKIAQLYTAAE